MQYLAIDSTLNVVSSTGEEKNASCLSAMHAHSFLCDDDVMFNVKDESKLIDFDFTNVDINSLRLQMMLPGHVLSPLSENSPGKHPLRLGMAFCHSHWCLLSKASPPTGSATPPVKHPLSPGSSLSDAPVPAPKRRRTSQSDSSLSDPDEDEDEEDQPLAARIPRTSAATTNGLRSGHRSGKKTSKKGVSHTSVPSEQPHSTAEAAKMNGRANGVAHEHKIKVEEKLDDRQLSRLATGVPVDTAVTAQTPVSPSFHTLIHCSSIIKAR